MIWEKHQNLPKRLGQEKRDAGLQILKLLVEKPLYPRDIVKRGFSRNTVNYHLSRFVKYRLARKLKDNRYAFITYVDAEEAVIKAIKQWREIAFRDPDPREIADETGLSLEDAERLARKTRNQTGWTMPNEAVKQSASERLGEVLVCAALLRDGEVSEDGKSQNFNYDNDMEIVEAARKIFREHPEMVPQLPEHWTDAISWSSQALKYLGKNYRPKNRLRPAFRFG